MFTLMMKLFGIDNCSYNKNKSNIKMSQNLGNRFFFISDFLECIVITIVGVFFNKLWFDSREKLV